MSMKLPRPGGAPGRSGAQSSVPLLQVAVATIIGASTVYVYRLLSHYGWDGTLRLLWEGSPYPPGLREQHEELDEATSASRSLQDTIQLLEQALEKAQRAEESNFSSILRQWQINVNGEDLRQELALLSHNLDLLAVRIDSVHSEDTDVKQRKKSLSQSVVGLMERADTLISFYTKASSPII